MLLDCRHMALPLSVSWLHAGAPYCMQVDDELAELFLAEEPISTEDLKAAIRRATLARRFQPVLMVSEQLTAAVP